jgi:hypothetical protein
MTNTNDKTFVVDVKDERGNMQHLSMKADSVKVTESGVLLFLDSSKKIVHALNNWEKFCAQESSPIATYTTPLSDLMKPENESYMHRVMLAAALDKLGPGEVAVDFLTIEKYKDAEIVAHTFTGEARLVVRAFLVGDPSKPPTAPPSGIDAKDAQQRRRKASNAFTIARQQNEVAGIMTPDKNTNRSLKHKVPTQDYKQVLLAQ